MSADLVRALSATRFRGPSIDFDWLLNHLGTEGAPNLRALQVFFETPKCPVFPTVKKLVICAGEVPENGNFLASNIRTKLPNLQQVSCDFLDVDEVSEFLKDVGQLLSIRQVNVRVAAPPVGVWDHPLALWPGIALRLGTLSEFEGPRGCTVDYIAFDWASPVLIVPVGMANHLRKLTIRDVHGCMRDFVGGVSSFDLGGLGHCRVIEEIHFDVTPRSVIRLYGLSRLPESVDLY